MERENKEFIDILTEKIVLYENLLESFSKEREAVKENSFQDILKTAKEKEVLVKKLEANEKKRREIIAHYSAKFNVPGEELTLLRLSRFFGEPGSGKLLGLRKKLKEQIESVSKEGKRNKSLMEACSSSLGKTRNFLEKLVWGQQEYSANGKTRNLPNGQGRVLNSKV